MADKKNNQKKKKLAAIAKAGAMGSAAGIAEFGRDMEKRAKKTAKKSAKNKSKAKTREINETVELGRRAGKALGDKNPTAKEKAFVKKHKKALKKMVQKGGEARVKRVQRRARVKKS